MSRINITNLTFSYDSGYDDVYHNMSISFDSSWKLGFIARNGRGKTTLLKLLLGEYDDGGAIHSDEHFSYFPPEIADESFNTLDVVDEINADYEFWKLVMEMNILGVDDEVLYRPWLTLSHGERTKVALAATFASEHANYILLDEPTTHLDEAGRRLVTEFLASKDGFMLVSHDRELLDQVVDHVLVMDEDGELIVRKGNFTQWKEDKDRDDAFKLGTDQKLKKEIGKMKEAAARQKSWSDDTEKGKFGYGPVDRGHIGHIAEKMMKRSKSFEKKSAAAIEQKEGLLSTIVRVDELSFNCVKYRSDVLIDLMEVSLNYGSKRVVENLNLRVNTGSRIRIRGANGAGKTTLIQAILGEDKVSTELNLSAGTIKLNRDLVISYVPQDTSWVYGSIGDFSKSSNLDQGLYMSMLRKLGFRKEELSRDLSELSEGLKKKVLLARSMLEPAHLYIWDEPLNYIDIYTRMQIEDAIMRSEPTMLYIEHDEVFSARVMTEELLIS